MKKIVFFLLIFVFLKASGQAKFENISFSEAVTQSQKTGRLILLQLESLDCELCNFAVLRAFEDVAISKRIKETFIAIRVDSRHEDRNLINGLYDLRENSFGTIFIDGNKNLILRFAKTTSLANAYNDVFDNALYNNSEVIKLNVYEDSYKKFNDNDHLERWIWARNALNLNNDSLLNVYVKNLSMDSANSERVLSFIANQAPLIGSPADQILRRNSQFKKVWYAISLKDRVLLNRKIISKSMQKAISEKNEFDGLSAARFARGVYSDNKRAGDNSYNYQAMKLYEGLDNMDKYMNYASIYLDSFLLQTTAADAHRIDSLKKLEISKDAKATSSQTIGNKTITTKSFSFKPISQNFTNSLNESAWYIYKHTDHKIYLQKALRWAETSYEYFEKFESLDTQARILYKLGKKKEAVEMMEKAISLKNKQLRSTTAFSSLDRVLKNMKEGKTVIDSD